VKKFPIVPLSEIEISVRLGETDPYGVVNNSEYFTYFEIARLDYAEKCGKILDEMFSSKIVNMTLSAECKYIKSCRLGDMLLIKTKMKPHILFCTYEFNQWIYNKQTNELLASATIKTAEFCLETQKILRWST
jgi:acyl-CoA thioester hydrolase